MVRPTALLLCIATILLIQPTAVAVNLAALATSKSNIDDFAPKAPAAAKNNPDLKSIGYLPLVFTTVSDNSNPSQSHHYFKLATADAHMKAMYRFASLQSATDLPQNSGDPIELPSNANFFEVQFAWCYPNDKDKVSSCEGSKPPDYYPDSCPPLIKQDGNHQPASAPCTIKAIFVRDLHEVDPEDPKKVTVILIPAFVLSQNGLIVSETLIKTTRDGATFPDFPTFTINGIPLKQLFKDYKTSTAESNTTSNQTYAARSGWQSVTDFHFERYPVAQSCRPYADENDKDTIDATRSLSDEEDNVKEGKYAKDNGIYLDPPKVFDVFTLRQLLNGTAAQLAGLAGFSPTSINAAFGNFQGVTTASSFLNAQVTTVPGPTVNSGTVNCPAGSTGSGITGAGFNCAGGPNTTTTTYSCPSGYYAAPAAAGNGSPAGFTCALITDTSPTNPTASITSAITPYSPNPNSPPVNTTGNYSTTSSSGLAGTVAPTLTPTAPTAPTNVGVSASDILTEQVQLNSQITNLRLALQGALSDQYLTQQGKATGTRQQSTLGFNISLDPPQRYKHAVAEVKIWIYHHGGDEAIKVVNLLPAAKTYNVAKVTNSQKAFGAGVVYDPVSVGVSGGKSNSRLYLAKDTDTVALLYSADGARNQGARPIGRSPQEDITGVVEEADNSNGKHQLGEWSQGATPIGRSPQEDIADVAKEIEAWQIVGDACDDDPGPFLSGDLDDEKANPLVFGWQFRPVLGADYVQSGQRQVFSQLALPVGLGQQYSPLVYIQTRWREYDSKKQVVGAVYKGSCSIVRDPDPIQVINPITVHDVSVHDMGGGILKVSATGNFLSQGVSVLSGQNIVAPTTFDGKSIEFFGNAASLLTTDDLTLEAENGELTPLGLNPVLAGNPDYACGITAAEFRATPRPDGNSYVEAKINLGYRYEMPKTDGKKMDGQPAPLFLVGSQVYGLHETPFLETACEDWSGAPICTYHFLASTDVLRAAETFTVRDLAWTQLKESGKIHFDPSFTALTLLTTHPPTSIDTTPPDNAKPCNICKPNAPGKSSAKTAAATAPPSVYTISGNDFGTLLNIPSIDCSDTTAATCLEVYQGLNRCELTDKNFQVSSKTTATIALPPDQCKPASENSGLIATPQTQITQKQKGGKVEITTDKTDAAGEDVSPIIFYSTDKTTPVADPSISNYYDGAFDVPSVGTTIKAFAIAANHTPSRVATAIVGKGGKVVAIPESAGATSAPQVAYKSYRFIWHSDNGKPVEWDLPVPPETPPAVTASTILNESDSTEVTFSNVQVLSTSTWPITFIYDGKDVTPIYKYNSSAMTLKVLITSDMTSKRGHKELLLNGYTMAPGTTTPSAVQIELPFDVTKR